MRKALVVLILITLSLAMLSCIVFAADWYPVTFKFSWGRSASGFCPSDSQCLVDPAGDKNNNNKPETYFTSNPPECIDNSQYINDYFCDNGIWTTRTKLLALQMLDFAEANSKEDFTLFCGPYAESLNNYHYTISQSPAQNFLENSRVNNFCVLNYKSGIAFGTSLNLNIDDSSYSFLNALNVSKNSCGRAINNDNDFDSCAEKIWYNHDTKSIIYLPSGNLVSPAGDLFTRYFKNPFQRILDYVYSVVHDTSTPGKDFSVFNRTGIYNNIYISRKSGKYVFAFLELGQSVPAKDYLGVKYSNLDLGQAPCDKIIKLYKLGANVYCEQQSGTEFIIVAKKELWQETPLIAAWKDITAKLRST